MLSRGQEVCWVEWRTSKVALRESPSLFHPPWPPAVKSLTWIMSGKVYFDSLSSMCARVFHIPLLPWSSHPTASGVHLSAQGGRWSLPLDSKGISWLRVKRAIALSRKGKSVLNIDMWILLYHLPLQKKFQEKEK